MASKASKSAVGIRDIHGLERFIEAKIGELKKTLKLKKKAPLHKGKAATASSAKGKIAAGGALDELMKKWQAHPKKSALVKVGKQKDQLLRSLIPLYLSEGKIEVTSGTMSRFWAKHGLTYAAPNAAKALRLHPGYAKRTAKGQQITSNGVKYVEQALMQ